MDLAKNLRVESVSRLRPIDAVVVSPDQPVRQAVAEMQEKQSGCALVCEGDRLTGIFTERDLIQRVLAASKPLSLPLRECMTPDPAAVYLKDSVATALRKMQEGGYRHLAVIDEAGRPVGILPVKRIVRFLVEHYPSTVYNQPPDPHAVQHDREGA